MAEPQETAQSEASGGPEKKRRPANGFRKGGDPRQYQSLQAAGEVALVPPDEPLHATMFRVLNQPKAKDKSALEKQFRKFLEKDMRAYLNQMSAMERAALPAGETPAPVVPSEPDVKPDERTARVRELISRLITEAGGLP